MKLKATSRRSFDGAMLDVSAASQFTGMSEKTIRARIARRCLPFRRFGGRIVFLRSELEKFLQGLPGCDLNEAVANIEARNGRETSAAPVCGKPPQHGGTNGRAHDTESIVPVGKYLNHKENLSSQARRCE